MKTDLTGKSFEALIYDFYKDLAEGLPDAKVELDKKILGPDGFRQIDVCITHKAAGHDYTTYIECKDHSSPLNVSFIDAFASKIVDLKASKGIIVSRRGFSKNALQKAARIGIDTVRVDAIRSLPFSSLLEMPFLWRSWSPVEFNLDARFHDSPPSFVITRDFKISGTPIMNLMVRALKEGKAKISQQNPTGPCTFDRCYSFDIDDFLERPTLLTPDNRAIYLRDYCVATVYLREFYSAGYVGDFESAHVMNINSTNDSSLFIDDEELEAFGRKVVSYRSLDDVPDNFANGALYATLITASLEGPNAYKMIGRATPLFPTAS